MVKDTPRLATMADVARLADVSVPTVSRVLSGAANVSDAKRQRVTTAIARLNFRPSAAARVLASRRADVIAVITGNTSQYGYAETLRGIEELARADGFSVIITVVETTDETEVDRALSMALSQAIAGLVVLKFDPPGVAALKKIPAGIPVVAISGVREAEVPQAVLDETRAAEELTNYLLDLGHETVHHVRVPPSRREDGRTSGWRRALKKAGAVVPPLIDATWDPMTGYEIGRRLADDPQVTAVFSGNDEIAMGVIRGLTEEGLRVPNDVSVVGFDNHPLAQLWSPPITTVNQDFAGLGRRGLELLLAAINNASSVRFSSERPALIIRASAGAPNASRSVTARAAGA